MMNADTKDLPMPERKSGPAKPPVIELTAREAEEEARPAAETSRPAANGGAAPAGEAEGEVERFAPEAESPDRSEPDPPAEEAGEAAPNPAGGADAEPPDEMDPAESEPLHGSVPPAQPLEPAPADTPNFWPMAGGAVLAGAILGAVLNYGVAAMGWLPTLPSPQQAARMASLDTRVTALESKIGEANATDAAAIQKLQQTVDQLQSAPPPPPPSDVDALKDQLKTLSGRLDTLAAAKPAPSGDTTALTASLEQLQDDIAALSQKVSALDDRQAKTSSAVSGLSDSLTGLNSDVQQNKSALAEQIAAARNRDVAGIRLPLLASSLEDAFATGRPYADELGSLGRLAPEITVPASVAAAADKGLPMAQKLRQDLEDAVPAMLAAAPGRADAGVGDRLVGWLKGVLAIRPAGAVSGDGPDAQIARIEAAVERGDYRMASNLIGGLPEPMRKAAGTLPAELEAAADGETLLDAVRSKALEASLGAKP